MKHINLFRCLYFCFIISFFFTKTSIGQNTLFNDSFATKKHFNIAFFGGLTAKSNAFPNSFYIDFYNGGYLTDEIKQNAAKKLKAINRFGVDADLGIAFRQKLDTTFKQTGWSYTVRMAERRHLRN
jgi:hypothetical protein